MSNLQVEPRLGLAVSGAAEISGYWRFSALRPSYATWLLFRARSARCEGLFPTTSTPTPHSVAISGATMVIGWTGTRHTTAGPTPLCQNQYGLPGGTPGQSASHNGPQVATPKARCTLSRKSERLRRPSNVDPPPRNEKT